MSRLRCKCGNALSCVDSPSENILYVWSEKIINNALSSDDKMTALDFLTTDGDGDYEIWYCPKCHRFMIVGVKERRVLKYYKESEAEKIVDDITDWQKFYEISDTQFDTVTERKFDTTLQELIDKNTTTYYRSSDEKWICRKYEDHLFHLEYYLEEIVEPA